MRFFFLASLFLFLPQTFAKSIPGDSDSFKNAEVTMVTQYCKTIKLTELQIGQQTVSVAEVDQEKFRVYCEKITDGLNIKVSSYSQMVEVISRDYCHLQDGSGEFSIVNGSSRYGAGVAINGCGCAEDETQISAEYKLADGQSKIANFSCGL